MDRRQKQKEAQHRRGQRLLAIQSQNTAIQLAGALDHFGITKAVLGWVMNEFAKSVLPLPDEAACGAGCSWCCHLMVETSIPELLVIHEAFSAQVPPEMMIALTTRLEKLAHAGELCDEDTWSLNQLPCPFIDEANGCLIYAVRPFACRAHHSLEMESCRRGYDEKAPVLIPSFPLYRRNTELYSRVFINVMEEKGFASFSVGFIKGISMLVEKPELADAWLQKEDVFGPARVRKRGAALKISPSFEGRD
ncbi:YkgJ family cysteine cluster protein [Desulfopila sp. IMCC35008]|uniref:YkgJ family cysteine cluster protein n=1 Tax=Desulfopila sp. IMCC35008 TaxID=2653858 RepID=UPI0013D4BF50|nr:YkgJ family cysteine cluster protein [Desulfopila sp. IMCC35008]